MLWLTLRQLKLGTAETRRKAAQELGRNPDLRALKALAFATLNDTDAGVRRAAAAALGRLDHPDRYEPLLKALQDDDPEIIRSALFGLRRATDERVIPALVRLLRHQNFSVRITSAQTHRHDPLGAQGSRGTRLVSGRQRMVRSSGDCRRRGHPCAAVNPSNQPRDRHGQGRGCPWGDLRSARCQVVAERPASR